MLAFSSGGFVLNFKQIGFSVFSSLDKGVHFVVDGVANTFNAVYGTNVIDLSTWTMLEDAGVVFLPATGCRYETSVSSVNISGYYWSASGGDFILYCDECGDGYYVSYEVAFGDNYLNTSVSNNPGVGNAVRLVRNAQ